MKEGKEEKVSSHGGMRSQAPVDGGWTQVGGG